MDSRKEFKVMDKVKINLIQLVLRNNFFYINTLEEGIIIMRFDRELGKIITVN